MVGVPGGSSGIDIARRLGLPDQLIDRARALLSPEAHEAAALIAYLHRSRDELDRTQQQMNAEQSRRLEDERKSCAANGSSASSTASRELEQNFAEMQKRFDENVAARRRGRKRSRTTRPTRKVDSRRKLQDARGEARDELNAALVQTLADSQSDLGISAAATARAKRRESSARRQNPRSRFQQARRPAPHRRQQRRNRSRPLRMKVAVDRNHRVEAASRREHPPQSRRASTYGQLEAVRKSRRPTKSTSSARPSRKPPRRVDKFLDDSRLGKSRAHPHNPRPRNRRPPKRPRPVPLVPPARRPHRPRSRRPRRQSHHRRRFKSLNDPWRYPLGGSKPVVSTSNVLVIST